MHHHHRSLMEKLNSSVQRRLVHESRKVQAAYIEIIREHACGKQTFEGEFCAVLVCGFCFSSRDFVVLLALFQV